MGAGASAESKDIAGKLEEKELKEFLKNMDAETAMKLSKAMDAAGTKGDSMTRAIWLWGEDVAKDFIEETEIQTKVPEKLDGKMLLLGEGEWESEEDKEKVDKLLMKTAYRFAQDQCTSEKPFVPPAALKKRAVWYWDEKFVKEFFEEVFCDEYYEQGGGGSSEDKEKELKTVETPKCDGKTLMATEGEKLDATAKEWLKTAIGRTTYLLMQDILLN
mmetsp:Transcript_3820/g.8882  ORF Transcript_3820/g.8882 Transcript_3820/m.8882 type:complete len:217 (+) Transcript_3820:57-707(+)